MDGSEHEERLTVQGRERRAHPRFSVDEDSVLLLAAHHAPVKARIVDLSLTGCRVRAYGRLSSKTGPAIEIAFRANGIDFRFHGVVQWSDEHNYFGIRFVNITGRSKKGLAEVIEEMAAAAAARAAALNTLLVELHVMEPAHEQTEETAVKQFAGADVEQAAEANDRGRSKSDL